MNAPNVANEQQTDQKLVMISGVTGAIGSQFLDIYGRMRDTVVYGRSRKALPYEHQIAEDGKLPLRTLIYSENTTQPNALSAINFERVKNITYVHALGLYPFEVDAEGNHRIENDVDGDGINDEVEKLTFTAFTEMLTKLREYEPTKKLSAVIFGGLADKHRPLVHESWWRTIEKTKEWAKTFVNIHHNTSITCANISSVLCPHEIITRPFVFTQTDADPRYWLSPHQLAEFLSSHLEEAENGFHEIEHYLPRDTFSQDYYQDNHFTPRKVEELFKDKNS